MSSDGGGVQDYLPKLRYWIMSHGHDERLGLKLLARVLVLVIHTALDVAADVGLSPPDTRCLSPSECEAPISSKHGHVNIEVGVRGRIVERQALANDQY